MRENIENIFNYVEQNKEWIFSAIGLLLVGLIVKGLFRRSADQKKAQEINDNSTDSSGFQSVEYVIVNDNTGLSMTDARAVALGVFEENMLKYAGSGKGVAKQRANQFREELFEKLINDNPERLDIFRTPDFQDSLFNAQKDYACSGNKELGNLLIDLLVERSKKEDEEERFEQIVLSEALIVAPKLTNTQLDILACCFSLYYIKNLKFLTLNRFVEYLNKELLIFTKSAGQIESNYQHLVYSGCVSLDHFGQRPGIVEILMKKYPVMFNKGFDIKDVYPIQEKDPNISKILKPCFHHKNLIQVAGGNDEAIKSMGKKHSISEDIINELIKINARYMMDKTEATNYLVSVCPKLGEYLKNADTGSIRGTHLTSVGIALALAHLKRTTGFDAPLSIWIK